MWNLFSVSKSSYVSDLRCPIPGELIRGASDVLGVEVGDAQRHRQISFAIKVLKLAKSVECDAN